MKNSKEIKNDVIEHILIVIITVLVLISVIVLSQIEYGVAPNHRYIDTPVNTDTTIDSSRFIIDHSKLN